MLAAEDNAAAIAVDIPIGLRDDGQTRSCDREARSLLASRSSSIFSAPPRSLLSAPTYAAALEQSRSRFGRGISKQAFHLYRKIAEVDSCLRQTGSPTLFEVHPELAFRQLRQAGLQHGKKSLAGYEERRSLLRAYGPLELPPADQWRAALNLHGQGAQRDDVADAAVTAVVALRIAQGQATAIPAHLEYDAYRIPMRILFWSATASPAPAPSSR